MRDATMVLLLATLGATGCAHTGWVRAGDRHAASGRWEQAIDDYASAQRLRPGSGRIARRLEHATTRLEAEQQARIGAALAKAEDAWHAGDWPRVVAHVEEALAVDPDDEVVGEVAWDAAQDLKELSAARTRGGAVREAYDFALLAARLAPGDPAMADAVTRTRGAVLVEAIARADAGAYDEAWTLASRVREAEAPELSAGVVEAIEGRWAAALHDAAKRDEARGKLGVALGQYARAADIGGSSDDLASRDRVAARLADAWRFTVGWSGSTSRDAKGLRVAVEQTLAADPRVAFASGGAFGVELTSVDRTCTQVVKPLTGEHHYVSGTRRVDNPAWATAYEDARFAEVRRVSAESGAIEWTDAVSRAERSVEWWLATDWSRANDDLRIADAALVMARRTEAAAEAALREAAEILDAARLDPAWTGTPVTELERIAISRARTYEEARAEREIAESIQWRRARDFETADRELDRLQRDLVSARDTLARARDEARFARTAALEAQATLDLTPEQIDEDVWSTHRYAMEDVTRTCEVTVNVAFRAPQGVTRTTLGQSVSTTDRVHEAQTGFGIPADPLGFASDDDQLVAWGLSVVAGSIAGSIEGGRDGHYADLYARGARTSDLNEATTLYAAALLLDPGAAPAGAVAWLEGAWSTDIRTLLGG